VATEFEAIAARLTCDDWNRLLAERFFRPEYGGTYVLFYIDRPLLAELAGRAEDDAVESLVGAIALHLRRRMPRELLSPLLSETVRWRLAGGEGPPPCLAALALAVLAASEMRREDGRAQSNYHAWFRDLISLVVPDIDGEDLWEAYAAVYPALWSNLEWWLEERHGGRLGKSTIAEDERNTKYGFADSQTIFLSSDREKLSQFFRWVRLRPDEELPSEELLQYFRIWASRRDDLSPGARLMIDEERLDQVQLGRLISEAAARWEGQVRDAKGRLEARLCLTLSRPPGSRLGLAAPCPAGFPRQLELAHRGASFALEAEDYEMTLAPDEQHWYGLLPLPVSEETLSVGERLEAEGRVFRLAAQWLYVLHMSRELGEWASVEQIRPGEAAWLLVEGERLEQVQGLLERQARPGWKVIESEGIAPRGWKLIRGVVVDPVETSEDPALGRLIPRRSNRFTLSGGLPLKRGEHLYLTGGDPDVMVPALEEEQPALAIELDGEPIRLESGASVVSLAALAPPEGNHLVRIGSVPKGYSTVRTLHCVAPPEESAVGHELRRIDGEMRPASIGAAVGAELPEDGARVRGSLVELGGAAPDREERGQLILPWVAERRVLIGEQPGEIEEVETPEEPLWMRTAGLRCQSFEYLPRIAARWLVVQTRMRGLQVRRLGNGIGTRAGDHPEELEPSAWAEAILACGADCAAAGEREEWERLRALAERTSGT
jgi:hypothetical protein